MRKTVIAPLFGGTHLLGEVAWGRCTWTTKWISSWTLRSVFRSTVGSATGRRRNNDFRALREPLRDNTLMKGNSNELRFQDEVKK